MATFRTFKQLHKLLYSMDPTVFDFIVSDNTKSFENVFVLSPKYSDFVRRYNFLKSKPQDFTDYLRDFVFTYTNVRSAEAGSILCLLYIFYVNSLYVGGSKVNTGYSILYHPVYEKIYNKLNMPQKEDPLYSLIEISSLNYDALLALIYPEINFQSGVSFQHKLHNPNSIYLQHLTLTINASPTVRNRFLSKPFSVFGTNVKEVVTFKGIYLIANINIPFLDAFLVLSLKDSSFTCTYYSMETIEQDNLLNIIGKIIAELLAKYHKLVAEPPESKHESSCVIYSNSHCQDKQILIPLTLRNLPSGYHPSEEAKRYATQLGITLSSNQTLVKEHIRNYRKGGL